MRAKREERRGLLWNLVLNEGRVLVIKHLSNWQGVQVFKLHLPNKGENKREGKGGENNRICQPLPQGVEPPFV